jgi:hypothetical protein
MKRIIMLLTVAALMVVAMTVAAAPGFAWEVTGKHCNAGNGNGNEGCDPGKSAPQNKGGDEIGCPIPEGGSTPNPGGNNVPC